MADRFCGCQNFERNRDGIGTPFDGFVRYFLSCEYNSQSNLLHIEESGDVLAAGH